jgi:hypothetical protein
MAFDLTHRMPIPPDAASGFVECGYRFKAWQPSNDDARRVLVLQVRPERDGISDPVREVEVPMWHPNLFGIDVEDMDALERATEDLVRELTR